jgi:hypothetical protein
MLNLYPDSIGGSLTDLVAFLERDLRYQQAQRRSRRMLGAVSDVDDQ